MIPYPVTMDFTTSIAVVMATLQIKVTDLLGLTIGPLPARFDEKLLLFWQMRHTIDLREALVGGVTLALLVSAGRVVRRVPAPLVGVVSLGVALAHRIAPSFTVVTIAPRFGDGLGSLAHVSHCAAAPSLALATDLVGPAFALAMLASIESLLSGVLADGLTRTKHDPNAELVGLGIVNVLVAMCGGIAAKAALARTDTNIRAGARSPFAASRTPSSC